MIYEYLPLKIIIDHHFKQVEYFVITSMDFFDSNHYKLFKFNVILILRNKV